jgi:predicted Zn-dependent protease with MMP-like domain
MILKRLPVQGNQNRCRIPLAHAPADPHNAAMDITDEEFDVFVQQAIEAIDPQFRTHLDEVPVVVEDLPDRDLCRQMDLSSRHELLGLFRGVPLNRRSVDADAGPHQIVLYRRNLAEMARNRRQLIEQIRKTIIHELGHYLGFSEEQLRRYHY